MSFVSVIARKDFITVMTDGRVSFAKQLILKEDYKKFKKISKKQFIAFTGNQEYCERIVSLFDYKNAQYNLKEISYQIHEIINQAPYVNFHVNLAIGGLNEDNEFVVYHVQNTLKQSIKELKTKKNKISYGFLNSEYVEKNINTEQKLVEYLRNTGFNTPNKCLKAQKLLNDYIASKDSSVNRNTFTLKITR